MNDPHVEVLIYRLCHRADVDYENAPALEHREPGFRLSIEAGEAKIELAEHFATEEEARATVEPFLRTWELAAALDYGPGVFEFAYVSAIVVDRKPAPGAVLHAASGHYAIAWISWSALAAPNIPLCPPG